MTETPVEAPAGIIPGTWHESAWQAIAAAALEQQRLGGADMDADRITSKVPAACVGIDLALDLRPVVGRVQYEVAPGHLVVSYPVGVVVPGPLFDAAVQLTVELYRRKDASFGVLNAWSSTGEALRISRDQLAGVESLLAPFRESWGIG